MYEFLEDKGLTRTKENANWTYTLDDEDKYSKSGYKSAQIQLKSCMLKCAIVRFNGELKFIYFTEGYVSLLEYLGKATPNSLWHVFGKVLESFLKVKNYGYLSCENIDVNAQNIYIDVKTLEPRLIYVPLISENNPNMQVNFEASIKRSFVKALRNANNPMISDKENMLLETLNDTGQGLEGMLKSVLMRAGATYNSGVTGKEKGTLQIICTDKRIPIHYVMKKERIKIGRKKDNDIVVDFTNQISRIHCSIILKNGTYYIRDERSTHGTYINNVPCIPNKEFEIHDGDLLRLPGIIFVMKIQ